MSCVMCQMSLFFPFFVNKVVKLVGGGSVTIVSINIIIVKYFCKCFTFFPYTVSVSQVYFSYLTLTEERREICVWNLST